VSKCSRAICGDEAPSHPAEAQDSDRQEHARPTLECAASSKEARESGPFSRPSRNTSGRKVQGPSAAGIRTPTCLGPRTTTGFWGEREASQRARADLPLRLQLRHGAGNRLQFIFRSHTGPALGRLRAHTARARERRVTFFQAARVPSGMRIGILEFASAFRTIQPGSIWKFSDRAETAAHASTALRSVDIKRSLRFSGGTRVLRDGPASWHANCVSLRACRSSCNVISSPSLHGTRAIFFRLGWGQLLRMRSRFVIVLASFLVLAAS